MVSKTTSGKYEPVVIEAIMYMHSQVRCRMQCLLYMYPISKNLQEDPLGWYMTLAYPFNRSFDSSQYIYINKHLTTSCMASKNHRLYGAFGHQ